MWVKIWMEAGPKELLTLEIVKATQPKHFRKRKELVMQSNAQHELGRANGTVVYRSRKNTESHKYI